MSVLFAEGVIKLKIDDSSMQGDLEGIFGKISTTSLTKSFVLGNLIANGIQSGLSAAGNLVSSAFDFTGMAIAMAGDARETQNLFGEVFKHLTDDADTFAREFSHKVGRSLGETRDGMARFQGQFTALGTSREQAFEFSKQLQALTVDLGSFYNMADSDVAARLRSFLRGNHEAAEMLGIQVNSAAIEQELLNMGFAGGVRKASELQKMMARLNIVTRQTADAQGDAVRTADSYVNLQKSLESIVTDSTGAFGQLFVPSMEEGLKVLRDWLQPLTGNIEGLREWGQVLGVATKNSINEAAEGVSWLRDQFDGFYSSIDQSTGVGDVFDKIQNWTENIGPFLLGASGDWKAAWDYFSSVAEIGWEKIVLSGKTILFQLPLIMIDKITAMLDIVDQFEIGWREGMIALLKPAENVMKSILDMFGLTTKDITRFFQNSFENIIRNLMKMWEIFKEYNANPFAFTKKKAMEAISMFRQGTGVDEKAKVAKKKIASTARQAEKTARDPAGAASGVTAKAREVIESFRAQIEGSIGGSADKIRALEAKRDAALAALMKSGKKQMDEIFGGGAGGASGGAGGWLWDDSVEEEKKDEEKNKPRKVEIFDLLGFADSIQKKISAEKDGPAARAAAAAEEQAVAAKMQLEESRRNNDLTLKIEANTRGVAYDA